MCTECLYIELQLWLLGREQKYEGYQERKFNAVEVKKRMKLIDSKLESMV